MTKFGEDDMAEMPDAVIQFRSPQTEEQLAAELRAEFMPLAEGLCAVLNRARQAGLRPEFTFAPDGFGRYLPPHLVITKSI